ncbi:TPA: hypothetical protein DCX62_02155 [Candidatus Azambacteria bacterium]|nr:MAG: VKORC1/thioredoxin domain protein [Candidatus Azambacteria bacterium GW2011_GWF1_41_10]KKS49161.1 MAG: VKORC1/thioredoxin domain protein [Candidatus Azambacteria bacterium GW2011_GWF2_42_22]HAJ44389.1 hypothetical protein [Candidatus Azambacteria bacterium]HAN61678.1 hypothetical protein [Candidatus Azambacteria bacterium]HAX39042.1 hypothetical protein [Candidatus Azambacteria bacterium]
MCIIFMNKKLLYIIGLIILALVIVAWYFYKSAPPAISQYDDFAKCLAEKKVAMYGADWCSHCQNEKRAFGSSFQFVSYVECPKNPQACLEKGVTGYPTWIFPDGKKLVGEQGIEKLSQESGCQLPLK